MFCGREYVLSCEGKVRHTTYASARKAVKKLERKRYYPGEHPAVYACKFCGRFHVGNTPDLWRDG